MPIIRQGISDGSVKTDYPEQLAELILLAANVWMNPMIFDSTEEESCRKFMVFRQMQQGFGLDIQKLFSKDFTLVVIGQIISLFGNATIRFALPLYLLNYSSA